MHLQNRHIYLSKRYDDSWQEQKIELAKAFKEMYHQKIHYFLNNLGSYCITVLLGTEIL